ncbi:MAG: nuclear transport factor 2 family protein [Gammaproteobacteria bacterium]
MTDGRKPGKSRAGEADIGRRSFFWKLGVGVSTALASATAMGRAASSDAGDAALRAAMLEEEKALRALHRDFEQALDAGRYDDVVALFADDAQVVFNGGVFDNRRQGIGRLYRELFREGQTGRRMPQAPGFEIDPERQQESVEISRDRLSARAVFPYSIRVGRPIESDSSLAAMARLHGEGVQTWWEGGVYEVRYRKDADGRWKISRLEYRTLARADWRPGRTCAMPMTVAPLATCYPEDPHGPDALVPPSTATA